MKSRFTKRAATKDWTIGYVDVSCNVLLTRTYGAFSSKEEALRFSTVRNWNYENCSILRFGSSPAGITSEFPNVKTSVDDLPGV